MKKENAFFQPSRLYKEYKILDLIEKNENVTQRSLSRALGTSVSMVNAYLNEFECNKLIERNHLSSKKVLYKITKQGSSRKKRLNISYLNATQQLYRSAKENVIEILNDVSKQGFKNILLYGAGEVAEILLHVVATEDSVDVNVIGIIDDDPLKQGSTLFDYPVFDFNQAKEIDSDGILISSFGYSDDIYHKLVLENVPKRRIIGFF